MRLPYAEVKKVMDKQFSAGSPLSSKQEAGKCEVGGGAVGGGVEKRLLCDLGWGL